MTKTRIVLADDHTLVRGGIRALLESIPGVEVVAESGDGREALELIAKHEPEVALLDIGMPALDGYEVARRVRLDTRVRDMVLIAVTGWGQENDKARAQTAGFDLHFTKPVEPTQLMDLLGGELPAR